MRTKGYLQLKLAPIFWKQLVGDELRLGDLKGVDTATTEAITMLRGLDASVMEEAMFQSTYSSMFVSRLR